MLLVKSETAGRGASTSACRSSVRASFRVARRASESPACSLVFAAVSAVVSFGVDAETIETAGFGVGVKRNLIRVVQAEFLDLDGDPSRCGLLQRNFDLQFVCF